MIKLLAVVLLVPLGSATAWIFLVMPPKYFDNRGHVEDSQASFEHLFEFMNSDPEIFSIKLDPDRIVEFEWFGNERADRISRAMLDNLAAWLHETKVYSVKRQPDFIEFDGGSEARFGKDFAAVVLSSLEFEMQPKSKDIKGCTFNLDLLTKSGICRDAAIENWQILYVWNPIF